MNDIITLIHSSRAVFLHSAGWLLDLCRLLPLVDRLVNVSTTLRYKPTIHVDLPSLLLYIVSGIILIFRERR